MAFAITMPLFLLIINLLDVTGSIRVDEAEASKQLLVNSAGNLHMYDTCSTWR